MKRIGQSRSAESVLSDITTIKAAIRNEGAKYLKLDSQDALQNDIQGIVSMKWKGNTVLTFVGFNGEIVAVCKIKGNGLVCKIIDKIIKTDGNDD